MERFWAAEEWLTAEEMTHLANVHAFHVYIAKTEHLIPDHETAHLRDMTPVEVVILRDAPGD